MAISKHEVNLAFCEALGIDPSETMSITFTIGPSHLPYVDVRYRKPLEGVVDALAEYELVPRSQRVPS